MKFLEIQYLLIVQAAGQAIKTGIMHGGAYLARRWAGEILTGCKELGWVSNTTISDMCVISLFMTIR